MLKKLVRFMLALTIFPWIFMLLVGCLVLTMNWLFDEDDDYPIKRNRTKYSDTLRRMQTIFDTWVLWFTLEDGKVDQNRN